MNLALIVERSPTPNELKRLRHSVRDEYITKALEHALYSVCVEINGNCVGCGRVVGDGGLYFYIQDVIVIPEHQGRGYGRLIIEHIFNFLESNAPIGSYVALFAAKGVEPLYQRYGFIERPNERFGAGMFQIWKVLCAEDSHNNSGVI